MNTDEMYSQYNAIQTDNLPPSEQSRVDRSSLTTIPQWGSFPEELSQSGTVSLKNNPQVGQSP